MNSSHQPPGSEGVDPPAANDSAHPHPHPEAKMEESQASPPDHEPDTEDTQEKPPDYITGVPLTLVMISIFLVTFLTLLDTSIIATAIPAITDEFRSLPDVGWYGSAYQLASASLQPLTGKIYTYYRSKWCYLVFFGLFELGSLICGLANSSKMLIVGRAVAGMGSSGIVNGALTILSSSVPLERRAVYTGLLLGFSQLGMVLGPLVGGALTVYSTWRWCFYINLPIGGAAALLLLAIRIPDQMAKHGVPLAQLHQKLDLVGFALFAPAPIQLLLALHYGEEQGWGSSTVIGLFCGAAATFGVWFVWNWRRGDSSALVPLSMAKRRPVWTSAITQMCLATSALMSSYFLPIFFQAVQSRTPLVSGLQLLPQIVPQIMFAMISGVLVSKTGYPIPYATAGAVLVSVGAGLLSLLNPSTSTGDWVGFQILCGIGRGVGSQMPIVAIQSHLKPSEISSAMSLVTFTQSLGTSVFLSISNTIVDQTLRSQLNGTLAEQVIAVGVTAFKDVVAPENVPAVEAAYAVSVDHVFQLAAAVGAASVIAAQGMGWVDVRKKKQQSAPPADEEKAAGAGSGREPSP